MPKDRVSAEKLFVKFGNNYFLKYMSKIGKKPIKIPQGITVNLTPNGGAGTSVEVIGPKGTLTQVVKPSIKVKIENGDLLFEYKDPLNNALQGLYRSLVSNMIYGVEKGWNKGLELKGVGFRAQVSGDKLILTIGFSHPVDFLIPEGITISVTENKINVTGIDKQVVGNTAAKIRDLKPPEPYKGKGIRYIGEIVRKKAGKQALKAGGAA